MKPLKIGILGGIGPEATGKFYLELINRLQKEKLITQNADYPQIIVNSIPAKELIFEEIKNEDLEVYIKGLKELDAMQVDFIVMVCNTIHLFHEELQSKINTQIIDLRKEVFKELKKSNINQVTIIGTPNTISQGLYNFPNIQYYNPDKKDVAILSKSINKFNQGIDKDKERKIVLEIVKRNMTKGSETVILACTEFATMLNKENFPKINTMGLLVNCVIDEYKKVK
jgi:aspartate racemase